MPGDDTLQQIAERHFRQSYEAFPVRATTLGIHSHDHTLGNYSSRNLATQVADLEETQRRLGQIDLGTLSSTARLDFKLVDADVKLALAWHNRTREWQRNPNFYAETPVYGVFLLTVRDFAPAIERARNVIARLDAVPEFLHTARSNLENPPRVYTEIALQTAEDGINFFETALPRFASTAPRMERQVVESNRRAVDAYKDFLSFLRQDLLPRSTGQYAVGTAHYEERLRLEHALDMSAQELKRTGQRIFDETERRLVELAGQIDRGRTWGQIVEMAEAEHPAADRLIDAYATEIKSLRSFIVDRDIVSVPQNERLELTPTPQFAQATLPYAAYFPPAPFEPCQEGHFWVTPVDPRAPRNEQDALLKEHCYYALPAIALHEAYPGHHVQLVHSNNVSSFIRKHIASNILCEGWAFYCEEMMREVGYRPAYVASSTDPERGQKLFHLFVLKDALWRASRIILDVGLHTEGMQVDDAVRLLTERVLLSQPAALAEVRRYTLSPTQPMSYAVGKHQIQLLRQEFGDLPMRQFHDMLLSEGTIPLSFVRETMLAKTKRQPGAGGMGVRG